MCKKNLLYRCIFLTTVILSGAGILSSCKSKDGDDLSVLALLGLAGSGTVATSTVATPAFSPVASKVNLGTTVTISSSTSGANFYYTTDGSTAPACSGTGTSGSTVTISAAMTIQAIACKSGLTGSSLASAAYTVDLGTFTSASAAEVNQWYSVTYGNGLFVAVAFDGTNRVMTSPDGTTWTARAAAEANNWLSVTYGNGLFVAVAVSGTNRVMHATWN